MHEWVQIYLKNSFYKDFVFKYKNLKKNLFCITFLYNISLKFKSTLFNIKMLFFFYLLSLD